jgi:Predicted oxidoreductases of the aldo/keto reductase family
MAIAKRTLGKSGIEVSQLGFGCMRLPLTGENPVEIDIPAAIAMIRRAIDAGVNYVDTAYPYHTDDHTKPGQSEPVTARALADGYREKVLVATKLPLWLVESRADMDKFLDEQLRRLDIPYIDMYLAHNINDGVWPKMKELGLFPFFDEALRDGRIRHAAFSFHDRYQLFEEVLDSYDWTMAQIQYNYLDVDHQAGRRGLALAEERGVGIVVMEPLRGGFLVNNLPEQARAILHDVRPGWSLAEWALRWVLDQSGVSTALSGMSTMEQLEENLHIAADSAVGDLTDQDRRAVEEVRRIFLERIQVGCTACGYCLPCPSNVAIPKVFAYFNEFHFTDDPKAQQVARLFYAGIMGDDNPASSCTQCGLCVDMCPQHINIPREMSKATELFHAGQPGT